MKDDRTNGGADGARQRDQELLVQEKLRIMRLVRALDRAGVDPEVEEAVRVPLVRLGEIDSFFTAMLAFLLQDDAAPDPDLEEREPLSSILPVAEGLRGEVLDAVPAHLQNAVRRASAEVVATETEVMLEVEMYQRRSAEGNRDVEARSGPITDAEALAIAEAAFTADGPATRIRADRRVRDQELTPPPGPDEPLRDWFDRLPRHWLEIVARLHDVPTKGTGRLTQRLAERISDAAWMQQFLDERLGTSERELLAHLLASPLALTASDDPNLQAAMHVEWDWAQHFPASVGGKLRAAGLVYVCAEDAVTIAIVPSPLRGMLEDLLVDVDPKSASLPERAARQTAAEELADVPYEDEDLERWKQADRDLTETIDRWMRASPNDLRAATHALFPDGPRAVHSPEERQAMLQHALFDWREDVGWPTLAERLMEEESFGSPEEQALAEAAAAALPTLFRVEGFERGQCVTLEPIFPVGDPVVVTDRGMSMTVEQGQIVVLRVYAAGPHHFPRACMIPLEAHSEKVVVRSLRRRLRAFVRDGGRKDPVAFLRACPSALFHVMRDFGD